MGNDQKWWIGFMGILVIVSLASIFNSYIWSPTMEGKYKKGFISAFYPTYGEKVGNKVGECIFEGGKAIVEDNTVLCIFKK